MTDIQKSIDILTFRLEKIKETQPFDRKTVGIWRKNYKKRSVFDRKIKDIRYFDCKKNDIFMKKY